MRARAAGAALPGAPPQALDSSRSDSRRSALPALPAARRGQQSRARGGERLKKNKKKSDGESDFPPESLKVSTSSKHGTNLAPPPPSSSLPSSLPRPPLRPRSRAAPGWGRWARDSAGSRAGPAVAARPLAAAPPVPRSRGTLLRYK